MAFRAEEVAATERLVLSTAPPEEDDVRSEPVGAKRIGRYDLCFLLAAGGMASVYLARMDGVPGIDKLVALKRIHPHLGKDPSYVDMFLDEARIASRVTHPNVCSVFDFGEADGEYYIAMEYLVGEPLSRLMVRVAKEPSQRCSPLLPLRMARIAADACEGLHAAHELKDANGELLDVVHRDTSPRNLFVTYGGAVQVVDFGIASARQRLHRTSTGEVKGTFAYMAPEQLTTGVVDRRTDIWALGAALWEALAIKRLFNRDSTANTVHSVLYAEVRPPSEFLPQVPKELDAIVLKALERDPRDRWQTAREMGRAIREFLGTRPEVIGPAELSEWMGTLFPQGEARKNQLMEIARLGNEAVPEIPRAKEDRRSLTPSSMTRGDRNETTAIRRAPRMLLAALLLGAIGMVALVAPGLVESAREDGATTPLTAPSMMKAPARTKPPSTDDEASSEGEEPVEQRAVAAKAAPIDERSAEVARQEAEKRTRSTRRAKAEPGTINLVTRGGWAEIYNGKKSLGSTPRRLTLRPGRHKLVLKPFGTKTPKTVFVNVEANKTKNVSIRLD